MKRPIFLNNSNTSVRIETVEDYSSSDYVKMGTEALVENDVDFLFAPYSTSLLAACANITEANDKLLFSGSASDTPDSIEHTFSMISGDVFAISTGLEAFKSYNVKSIGVLKSSTNRCQKGDVLDTTNRLNM